MFFTYHELMHVNHAIELGEMINPLTPTITLYLGVTNFGATHFE